MWFNQRTIGEAEWTEKWLIGNIPCVFWFSGCDFIDVQTTKYGKVIKMSSQFILNNEERNFVDVKSKAKREEECFCIIIYVS